MPHILVVDDRPDVRAVIQMALENLGHYRVSAEGGGDAALPVLDRDRPDLVLLDAVMPGMPAMEFALYASQRDIPVIVMTGHPEMGEALARLGWPYLHKPFRLGQLLVECSAAITQARENLVICRASLHRLLGNHDELGRLIEQARRSVEASQRRRAERSELT